MSAPVLPRDVRKMHVADRESRFPLRVLGILPRGAAVHVRGDDALDFLAKKRLGFSWLGVAQAEVDLSARLGRPVGIVLTSEVQGAEAARLSELARPL